MRVPIEDILKFHIQRTQCHIDTVNYFGKLLGAQFPTHDCDKYAEPYKTGYAFVNYANHHPKCVLLPAQRDAFRLAHDEHHRIQPHHTGYYKSVLDIPPHIISEMVCDWHSANFEQSNILHDNEYESVTDWFNQNMALRGWSDTQLEQIMRNIDIIKTNANLPEIYAIWDTLKT